MANDAIGMSEAVQPVGVSAERGGTDEDFSRRWFISFVAGLFLLQCGCATTVKPAEDACPHCSREATAARSAPREPARGQSLFTTNATWTTDAGASLTLAELAGRSCVLAFFFTSCSFKCPITVENLRQVEAALPREARSGVRFVLVTFDPGADSCEVLRRYRTAHRLGAENWLLLRGTPADVDALARQAGFGYQANGVGGFNHDSVISVLDAAGRVVYQNDRLYGGVNEIQLRVRALLAGGKG